MRLSLPHVVGVCVVVLWCLVLAPDSATAAREQRNSGSWRPSIRLRRPSASAVGRSDDADTAAGRGLMSKLMMFKSMFHKPQSNVIIISAPTPTAITSPTTSGTTTSTNGQRLRGRGSNLSAASDDADRDEEDNDDDDDDDDDEADVDMMIVPKPNHPKIDDKIAISDAERVANGIDIGKGGKGRQRRRGAGGGGGGKRRKPGRRTNKRRNKNERRSQMATTGSDLHTQLSVNTGNNNNNNNNNNKKNHVADKTKMANGSTRFRDILNAFRRQATGARGQQLWKIANRVDRHD